MYRLGGWARIGIVISVLWCALIFGFAGIEYLEFSEEHKTNLSLPKPPKGYIIDSKAQGFFFKWQPLDLFSKEKSVHVRDFGLQGGRFFIAWLSPIIALWVFSFVFVRTSKWVKAGFSVRKNRS